MKALKRRIISVGNTQQIMKAMNLVAASKVQRNRAKYEAANPMFVEAQEFMANGVSHQDAAENIYYESRDVKKSAYVVISGERGLCGGYNANLLKEALAHMDTDKNEQIIAVGAKCREYFVRRRKDIVAEHVGVLENVAYSTATAIACQLIDMFTSEDLNNRVDEIYIAYTQYETLLSYTPKVVRLLPFEPLQVGSQREAIYEPDVHTYLHKAVPVYLAMFIFGAMTESAVCEQAARMVSMDAAARNAEEIIEDLTLQYNRQRQDVITQEISEIVGGANAI
jgi:F-type H+-transporting ATPase subunit gamma